jgi:ubiquinone/menaquinone biosynthesis C-methylase UbiE
MSSQYNNINQAVTPDYYQEAGEVSENMFTNPGFVDILGYLKDCTSILEVGCGNGVKTIQMSRINQRSAGCDISSYAIEQARTSYPGIDFFVSDCLQITQPDATYDGVYSFLY